jgi:hypothetical protein
MLRWTLSFLIHLCRAEAKLLEETARPLIDTLGERLRTVCIELPVWVHVQCTEGNCQYDYNMCCIVGNWQALMWVTNGVELILNVVAA